MGSSIASAQGLAHTDDNLNVAIIGDGTFFHSGIPAFLNAVHNKVPILVLILDNGWIGMTGQQPHPGSDTHYYDSGHLKKSIDLEKFLKGSGAIVSVITHSNKNRDYVKLLKNLIYEKSLDVIQNKNLNTILIKDECLQKYVKRHEIRIRKVNTNSCNNCGLCYDQLLCSAISEQGNSAFIDSKLCLGCGICEEICPNKAIYEEESK